jgi:PAS domain S-box-containing protein
LKGIFGAVQDITEQKLAEEALRKSETIYRKAIEVFGAVPYHQTFDPEGKIHYDFMGDGIVDITGYSPDEFTDDLWGTLVVERHLLDELEPYALNDAIQEVRTGNIPIWKCEHKIKDREGNIHWVFEAAVDLRDEKGIAFGSVGMYQDITERKLAEEYEQRRRVMLEKVINLGQDVTQVQDLRTTLKAIWQGVSDLGFDRTGIYLYDPTANSVNGTFGTDFQGSMTDEWTSQISLAVESIESKTFVKVVNDPLGVYVTRNYNTEHDGNNDPLMVGVKDFAAVNARVGDKPIAVICVDQVISGRSISNEQLEALRLFAGYAGLAIENSRLHATLQTELNQRQELITELESKNAELERFTYTVSHDLKSPLVTITGFLGYIEQDLTKGNFERIKGNMSRIANAAQKMQELLNDLLELSRIGRLMNEPEAIPFGEIVNEAIDRVHGRLDEIDGTLEVQRDLPVVYCDRVRLVEVVQNLIDNAVKYRNPNRLSRIEIGTNGLDEKDHTIFFVRDNGIGIEPQYHDRIFGLFNKLDSTSDGTGIGLSLVKRIIEVHNGRIWVESQSGHGSTFFFTLPSPPAKE